MVFLRLKAVVTKAFTQLLVFPVYKSGTLSRSTLGDWTAGRRPKMGQNSLKLSAPVGGRALRFWLSPKNPAAGHFWAISAISVNALRISDPELCAIREFCGEYIVRNIGFVVGFKKTAASARATASKDLSGG